MHISKFVLALLVAGTSLNVIRAQVMTPAEQQKAVELLRQKLAEERGKGAPSKPVAKPAPEVVPTRSADFQPPMQAPAKPETPKATAASKTAAKPSASTGTRKSRTLWDALKNAFSGKGGSSSASAKTAPAPTVTKAAPTQPTAPKIEEQPAAPVIPPIAVPAGPPTKQQRLMELFELYRTDKIGPIEYHERRAKILAEP